MSVRTEQREHIEELELALAAARAQLRQAEAGAAAERAFRREADRHAALAGQETREGIAVHQRAAASWAVEIGCCRQAATRWQARCAYALGGAALGWLAVGVLLLFGRGVF